MTTVAPYFALNTGFSEREAETTATTICSKCFRISNLLGVGFTDASGKRIKGPDLNQRTSDLTHLFSAL